MANELKNFKEEFLTILDSDHQQLMKSFDKKLESILVSLGDRKILKLLRYVFDQQYQNTHFLFTTAFFVQDINDSLNNIETIVLTLVNKTGTDLSELKTEIEDLKKTVKRPVFDHIEKFIKERKTQMEEMKKSEGKGEFYVF